MTTMPEIVLVVCLVREQLLQYTWWQLCTIAAALVTSRLDYANSVLYGIPTKYTSRLQRTQNTLARVVAGNRTPGSHLATLSKLHWLPVHDRIKIQNCYNDP